MSEFLHWFPGEGFRPARYAQDYIGPRMDCPLIVKAEDEAYLAKFDPYEPLEGYAWGTWLPNALQEAAGQPLTGTTLPPGIWVADKPLWPSVTDFGWPSVPPIIDYPCRCIEVPPDVPPIAPVPLPASGLLMIGALCIAALLKRKRPAR